jgi:hypothetical protein
MQLWEGFRRTRTPGAERTAVQLTEGTATCYPLYYFIPSFTHDGRHLVYHRAEAGEVQLYILNLSSGESTQLTHGTCPATRWVPWCVESGSGILDHRSVLDVKGNRVIYFDGNDVRCVELERMEDRSLFVLPEDRLAIGQNCMSPDGEWFVFIHHDRKLFDAVYPTGAPKDRCASKGTVLAAYNLQSGEHRTLVVINSPIHHVVPYGDDGLVFCHPATENGMLLTDTRGGWYAHLRTQDEMGGCVCHYLATERGIAYEVLGRKDGVRAGLYDPASRARYELPLPQSFGYTHTGWDPEGRLWFFENSSAHSHDLQFLVQHDPDGEDRWTALTGNWPTYGRGQKSHFHPQLSPDRNWILMTGGDSRTETNHLFLVNVSDLQSTRGIPRLAR